MDFTFPIQSLHNSIENHWPFLIHRYMYFHNHLHIQSNRVSVFFTIIWPFFYTHCIHISLTRSLFLSGVIENLIDMTVVKMYKTKKVGGKKKKEKYTRSL